MLEVIYSQVKVRMVFANNKDTLYYFKPARFAAAFTFQLKWVFRIMKVPLYMLFDYRFKDEDSMLFGR